MAWAPHFEWGPALGDMADELRCIILATGEFEPARQLTSRPLLGHAKMQGFGPNVEIVEAPVGDIWMREIAPMYIANGSDVVRSI